MKLEPKQNGTWRETVELEVQGKDGKMIVYITFDTYSHIINVQLLEGINDAMFFDKNGKAKG